VKLLFDANLSPVLLVSLEATFPHSTHVRDIGFGAASDADLWDYAKANGFTIVSKDTDFRERSFVHGFPPKVIWLAVGNAATVAIAELLRRERTRIEALQKQPDASLLVLSSGASVI
jgi:predicted nuclease of predicted toxin-antitoxin system